MTKVMKDFVTSDRTFFGIVVMIVIISGILVIVGVALFGVVDQINQMLTTIGDALKNPGAY